MKHPNVIASIAAALLTTASLIAVNYNVVRQPSEHSSVIQSAPVSITNLAPIHVYPDAPAGHVAALQLDLDGSTVNVRSLGGLDTGSSKSSLFGSQLTMPYYSFGNTLGRISKE